MFDELRKLGILRRKEQILARRHSAATLARKEQERHVNELMQGEGFEKGDSIRFQGLRYSPEETIYATIQDRAKLVEYLKREDETVIEEKLRKGELNRIVREKMDNGEPLPPGLSYYVDTWVGIKGISGKINQQEDDDE